MRRSSGGPPGRRQRRAATGPDARDFQLETRHLAFLIALVVALCIASFMLGRWVERQSLGAEVPGLTMMDKQGDGVIEDMGDVSEELTFFDTLKNDKPVTLEDYPDSPSGKKGRRGSRRRAEGGSKPRDQDSMRSVGEGIMIQVLASGQRSVAKALTTKLRRKGYTALLIKEGGTYKVRVGPYADRVEAERAAGVLREQEHLTTWIP